MDGQKNEVESFKGGVCDVLTLDLFAEGQKVSKASSLISSTSTAHEAT